jgi:hypothetical protein
MDRTVMERVIFISVFFTIIFSMHLYSYMRLSSLMEIDRRPWHYVVVALLASSMIFSTILCSFSFNAATRALYAVSACWFGIQFLFFSAVFLYEVPRPFVRIDGSKAGMAIIVVVAILAVISIISAQFTRVKKVNLPSFGGKLNAVLLSDLHVGTIRGEKYLAEIVEMTNALEPDVVFITGDIVSGAAKLRKGVFEPLADLKAKTFFVNGNHEHYDGVEIVDKMLRDVGVTVLINETVEFNGIEVMGVDYRENEKDAAALLAEMEPSGDRPTILLSHAPIDPKDDRIGLVLSGHTHGGQIMPFYFIVKLRYKFMEGLYDLGGTSIYVTPGTSTWGPPMRLGTRNEITHLTSSGDSPL